MFINEVPFISDDGKTKKEIISGNSPQTHTHFSNCNDIYSFVSFWLVSFAMSRFEQA
jgi:hypothetical protein